jgi:hypothetical protein
MHCIIHILLLFSIKFLHYFFPYLILLSFNFFSLRFNNFFFFLFLLLLLPQLLLFNLVLTLVNVQFWHLHLISCFQNFLITFIFTPINLSKILCSLWLVYV